MAAEDTHYAVGGAGGAELGSSAGIRANGSARRGARGLGSVLGAFGLVVLSTGLASAQDNIDAELEALEAAAEANPSDSGPAAAPPQTATEQAPQGQSPPEAAADVDEVVVTVDRRRKSLQDYSGVAAAFSESKLQSVGVTNVRDLAQMVPGLQIGVQEGNAEIYIRGVGSDNNTELGDPAVALHIDGVYVPRPRGVGAMFFDIARVEVSSGPQGTLRGRNAMGGTVNIVSKQPELGEYGANAQATFGTFNQRRYQGMVNIPLGETVAFRAAGYSEVRDSFWQNGGHVSDIKPAESADAWAARAQLKYEPSARFTALAAFDYTREAGAPYLGANYQGALTATDDEENIIPFDPNDVDNPRNTYLRGQNPSSELDHWGARLTLSYDLGPATVEAVGSFRRMQFEQNTGSNAGAIYDGYGYDQNTDDFTNGFWDTHSDSIIAELRAYAPDTARFRWTAGAFFFDEQQDALLAQVADGGNFYAGGEFNMPGVTGQSIAGYADATFDVTSDFRVLAGVRVTNEQKTRNDGLWMILGNFPAPEVTPPERLRHGSEGYRPAGYSRTQYTLPENYADLDAESQALARVNMYLAGVESFGSEDTLPSYLCADPERDPDSGEFIGDRLEPSQISASGFQCANGLSPDFKMDAISVVPQNNDVNNTFFDWRVGAEYDLTKDSLLYATVSTGHKAGGFNDTVEPGGGGPLINTEYDVEDVLAFEIGSKNILMDRKLRLNASAFAYLYDNYVFQTIATVGMPDPNDPDAGTATTAQRQNAPQATVYGADVDVMYRLPAGLEAEAHVLLMDARFGPDTLVRDPRLSFNNDNNYLVNLDGNYLPRASPLTVNFALSQLINSPVGSFDWVIQGQTRAKSYMTVFNGDGAPMPRADGMPVGEVEQGEQRLVDSVPTYTTVNLGAGWRHPDGRLAINGYVNNATNIAYTTSIISNRGLNLRFFNPPRQAGVRVRVDW